MLPPGYAFQGLLGHGGFATVVAAERESDHLPVAVKIAHGRGDRLLAQRFKAEAEALARLGPPVVPILIEHGSTDDGLPFLVMERVNAPTLASELERISGPMPALEAARRAEGLLRALEVVHAHGLIHCDLKPENIFVESSPPRVRLIDFGLTEIAAPKGEDSTKSTTPAGTAEYMSPEQCDGAEDIDARSDIYAAGVVLYELWTGRPPFFGGAAEVQEAHRIRRPQRPSSLAVVSPKLEQVILRCLSKDRDERFSTVAALNEALQQALAQGIEPADTPPPRPSPEAAKPSGAGVKRQLGAVFLETTRPESELVKAARSFGGAVAYLSGQRCVVVFDQDAGENPVQRAIGAAQALCSRKFCQRASVDLLSITVQQRPNGALRFLSSEFAKEGRYSASPGAGPVTVTDLARSVLPSHADGVGLPASDQLSIAESATSLTQAGATSLRVADVPLVGREDVLEALVQSARLAHQGPLPTIATVIAEPGEGKSRLSGELLARLYAARLAVQIVELRAREPVDGDADAVLRELLKLGLDLPAGSTADAARSHFFRELGDALGQELWPAAALVMGWLPPAAPELAAMRAAPGVLRSSAMRAAGEALRRRAKKQPIFLLLDDVQFADLTALDALEYATLPEAKAPLWVCVLGRPAFEATRPSWGSRAGVTHRHVLGPLPPAKAAELCRRLLEPAQAVSDQLIQRFVERTQGVPLLLVELVRGLRQEGLVQLTPRGEWAVATEVIDRVPDLPVVDWMAQRELGALPPELAAHARLAAQLGAEFTLAEAEGVMRELERSAAAAQLPLDPKVGVKRLRDSGLLISRRGARLSFRHALVRDSVARGTAESLRQAIHEAAFRFYQATDAVPRAERIPRLAHHAARSGHRDSAASLYLELAGEVADRHDYLEAELMLTRALEQLPETEKRRSMIARWNRGVMRIRIGRYEASLEDLSGAKALAEELAEPGVLVDVLLDEAAALDWVSDFRASKARLDLARSLCADRTSPALEAKLLLGLGRSQWRLFERAAAVITLQEVRARAEKLGDEGYEPLAISLMILGDLLPFQGQLEEAEQVFDQLTRLCQAKGDQLYLGVALNNRRNLHIGKKALAPAAEDQERFIQIGRELGIAIFEYNGAFNVAELYYQGGELPTAWAKLDRLLDLEARHSAVAPRPIGLLLKARLLAFEGRAMEAEVVLGEVQARVKAQVARGRTGVELFPNEQVLFDMVALTTRDAGDAEWDALIERSRQFSLEQEPLEVLEMRALARARFGHPEVAIRAFRQTLEAAKGLANLMEPRIHAALAAVLAERRAG